MRYLSFFLAFWLLISHLFAQTFRANIKQYTEKEGLSSNEVLAIEKDARGIIWVATKYGLNRFDGKQFKVFTTQDGLYSNNISQIFVDKQHIWLFYTETASPDKYIRNIELIDIVSHKIQTLEDFWGKKLPFKQKEILEFKIFGRHLLFELPNKKYFLYDKETGFTALNWLYKEENLLHINAKGEYWVSKLGQDSTYLIKRNIKGIIIGKCSFKQTNYVRFGCEDGDGNAYFALAYLKGKQTWVQRVTINANCSRFDFFTIPNIEAFHAQALFIPSLKLLWFASEHEFATLNSKREVVLAQQILNAELNTMYKTAFVEGNNVWLCSHQGVFVVELNVSHFAHLFPNFSLRAIIRDNHHLFLGGTPSCQANIQDLSVYRKLNFSILSATQSASGDIWFANFFCLNKYGVNTHKVEETFIPLHEPWAGCEDAKGRVWLSQNGLTCFDPTSKRLETIDYGDFSLLKQSTVYYFYPIEKTKWLLCATSGLYELNPLTQRVLAHYSAESPAPFHLPANDFRHLYFDRQEKVFWLATGQNGIVCWNPVSKEAKLFNLHRSIVNVVHGIYADDYGFLWLSTEGGIVQFHKKTHQFKVYTVKDGLPTNEFNRISHFQDTDGTLYFGSVNGLVRFHPKNFSQMFYEKEKGTPFVIEVLQYIGKTNQLENVTATFQQENKIYLRPNDRFFTLTMGVKEYVQADIATYFYKLKANSEDSWTEAKNNQITLGRLPYGNQTLEVKVLLSYGQFSDTIAEIPIYVERPFYATWWFVTLLILIIGALGYWRFRELQQRNIRLEQEVKQRTQVIAKQAAELQQIDELKSRFFANVSHELRTPITLILNPLTRLLENEKEATERESLLLIAKKNSQKLLRLVNEILDLTKLETASLTIETQEVVLLGFIRHILTEFETLAARKGVLLALDTSIEEHTQVVIDTKKVETILYNLIGNALKFTPKGGSITVKVCIATTDLQVEVQDNGAGIQAQDLPYIFDRFYQAKTNSLSEGGSGLGLALSKELAHLLSGEVWATSEWGKGSSFFLYLPKVVATSSNETASFEVAFSSQEEEINNAENYAEVEMLPLTDTYLSHSKPNILLVEDNADLQEYIANFLRTKYEVTVKDNGQQAFTYLESLENKEDFPHLIISDIMMPQMDGYQLLHLLKSSPKYQKMPIIMLTARAGLEDKLKALQMGVDDYLTKPFVEIELLVRIENLLRNAIQRQQAQIEYKQEEIVESNSTFYQVEIPSSEWLQEVEKIVYDNMAKPDFSIQTISDKLGITRQTFNLHIRKEVGMTAVQYLQEIKLQYARKLLEAGEVENVKFLAESIGIKDVKYFSRLFKNRFGRFPTEYLI